MTGHDEAAGEVGTSAVGAPMAKGRLLSTMNEDGSRRWLRPWLSQGKFWKKRRIAAYALILAFTLVPHLSIFGGPVLLLDVQRREFHFFGSMFLPRDTVLMALLMVCLFMTIFMVTALFGRVWCGWACPQTVYMEFLYRPIERFFDGNPAKKRQRHSTATGVRRFAKYAVFFLCSLFLAHTFLAYFVPPHELVAWLTRSPAEHPTAFIVVVITTGLMMFDFCFFREQTCLIACPYGRLQAAMLDRHSLIVTYDEKRGEPRGRMKRRAKKKGDAPADDIHLRVTTEERGDCIDCHKCVTTCPTGIDIRDGLQMECIGCAQCIDACNDVMAKIGKPLGLVRYSSQAAIAGERSRIVRPRLFVYPSIVMVLLTIFVVVLSGRATAEAQILPSLTVGGYALESGDIGKQVRMRLINRSDAVCAYTLTVAGTEGGAVSGVENPVTLEPGESRELSFIVSVPSEAIDARGQARITLIVSGEDGYEKELRFTMLAKPNRGGEGS